MYYLPTSLNASSSSHVSSLPVKHEEEQETLEGLLSVFAEKLALSISHSPDGSVDYSHDIDTQNLMKKIHHLDPKIIEEKLFANGKEFIFSQEEAHTLLNTCNGELGIDYEAYDPKSTDATDLFTQVRSDSAYLQSKKLNKEAIRFIEKNKKEMEELHEAYLSHIEKAEKLKDEMAALWGTQFAEEIPHQNLETQPSRVIAELNTLLPKVELNLNYHPTLEILQVIEKLDSHKSITVKSRIEGNNDHLALSADLVKFASRLRKDNKDNKGVDYSNDEEMKKEIHKLYGIHPHIFGNVKKDNEGHFASFKFSNEEVEAMKTSAGEQTQILMGRQNINKGYIENEMQEKNHLWELGHNIHKETSSLIEKINSKTSRG